MDKHVYSINIGADILEVEFNNLAERAHGSCIVRQGGTAVLVTAVISKYAKESVDFLPLTIEYEEKFYAAGKILGSRFSRREGKPSEEAVLSGRVIDRTIRPLFDQWIRNEIQIIISVLAIGKYNPDMLALLGTSLAIGTSKIPWNGPVSGVRVSRAIGTKSCTLQPQLSETADDDFELVACGKEGTLNMLELGGKEISEDAALDAMMAASKSISVLQRFQKKIIKERGADKLVIPGPKIPAKVQALFDKHLGDELARHIFTNHPGDTDIESIKEEWLAFAAKKFPKNDYHSIAVRIFETAVNKIVHDQAIDYGKRTDGRGVDDIRPLLAQAGGVSQMLHGSGIFYRGQTHIFSALTLGGPNDTQAWSETESSREKRFMHHYNFPPFSVGDTGKAGIPNRRMIGHGALAEKALLPVIPPKEIFPYAIRIVSEAFSSNGSTSMASVCASTIALMDGGVPITRPVAGISLGIMMRGKDYKILTDIQGPEDHYGDMDFKVAGTRSGITAIQMDVKVDGVPLNIFKEAFAKSKSARTAILAVIKEAILAPRKNISIHAPHIISTKISPEAIGLAIGPGGKNINSIIRQTGVSSIDIDDNGLVYVTGRHDTVNRAMELILSSVQDRRNGRSFDKRT